MKNIKAIVEQLTNTSSTNDKIAILRSNKDNELLKKVLKYTLDPELKFGVSEKQMQKIEESNWRGNCNKDIFQLLDVLATNSINNSLRREIGLFKNENEDIWNLYRKIILKNLQAGISIKTINKVWPGVVDTMNVMKANSYDDKKDWFNKRASKSGYIEMIKRNGIRGEVFRLEDKVIIKTRQNKVIEGLVELEEAFLDMPVGFYEGELLALGEYEKSQDQFKATDKILSTDGIKSGIYIELFDNLTLEEFYEGKSVIKCIDRKTILKDKIIMANNDLIINSEPKYIGIDVGRIEKSLDEVTNNDKHEGLMIALCEGIYESGKKVNQILKVKKFYTMDLRCIGIEEGKQASTKGRMGSAIVDFKGNRVGVSGWTDEERIKYWNKPNELIGKIIEVKFKEVTKDKNGNESLQFAQKVRIREEGKEVSYN